jgi:hypothetical protein
MKATLWSRQDYHSSTYHIQVMLPKKLRGKEQIDWLVHLSIDREIDFFIGVLFKSDILPRNGTVTFILTFFRLRFYGLKATLPSFPTRDTPNKAIRRNESHRLLSLFFSSMITNSIEPSINDTTISQLRNPPSTVPLENSPCGKSCLNRFWPIE